MKLKRETLLQTLLKVGRYALLVLGFAVVFGTHFSLTTYYLDRSHMGADEGFYAIAARNAVDGQLPYRDYGYTQMPLLPYWNGLAMEIVGAVLSIVNVTVSVELLPQSSLAVTTNV